jgi:hypothetical protein
MTPFVARASRTQTTTKTTTGIKGGCSSNYSGPNPKRKPDNTVAAIQRSAKDHSKKTSGGFKDLLKEKCPWHLDGNTLPSNATKSGEHSGILQNHDTLMTRKARKRPTKATATSKNPTRR